MKTKTQKVNYKLEYTKLKVTEQAFYVHKMHYFDKNINVKQPFIQNFKKVMIDEIQKKLWLLFVKI